MDPNRDLYVAPAPSFFTSHILSIMKLCRCHGVLSSYSSLLFTLSSSPFTHHLPHMVISFSPFLLILTLPGFKGQEERLGKWAGSKYLADTGQGFSKLTQFFCRNLPESLRDPGRALCAYSSVMWKSPHLWLLRLLSSFISPLAFIA